MSLGLDVLCLLRIEILIEFSAQFIELVSKMKSSNIFWYWRGRGWGL